MEVLAATFAAAWAMLSSSGDGGAGGASDDGADDPLVVGVSVVDGGGGVGMDASFVLVEAPIGGRGGGAGAEHWTLFVPMMREGNKSAILCVLRRNGDLRKPFPAVLALL